MIFASARQVDKAILFSTAITLAAFLPLFTMQGVEGQIFSPMARTYAYALAGALIGTFTVTPVLTSLVLPEHPRDVETIVVRALRAVYHPVLHWALSHRVIVVAIGVGFLAAAGVVPPRPGGGVPPALKETHLWIRAPRPAHIHRASHM